MSAIITTLFLKAQDNDVQYGITEELYQKPKIQYVRVNEEGKTTRINPSALEKYYSTSEPLIPNIIIWYKTDKRLTNEQITKIKANLKIKLTNITNKVISNMEKINNKCGNL